MCSIIGVKLVRLSNILRRPARLRVAKATVQTLNVKICSMPFFVLAILAYAELMYSNQMGNDVISAHRIGRKLTSSHSGDFELVDISSTISIDWKFSGAETASDGKIIFAPLHSDGVGVFEPELLRSPCIAANIKVSANSMISLSSHSCVVLKGGNITCWGMNYYGKLDGNEDNSYYSTWHLYSDEHRCGHRCVLRLLRRTNLREGGKFFFPHLETGDALALEGGPAGVVHAVGSYGDAARKGWTKRLSVVAFYAVGARKTRSARTSAASAG